MTSIGNIINTSSPPAPTPLVPIGQPSSGTGSQVFKDILDTINPLQHIPVVSSIYRAATGQTINPISKIAGDTIYGIALGGTGLANIVTSVGASVADTAVTEVSGSNIGSHFMSAVSELTSNNGTSPTPLVPDSNSAVVAATIQAQATQPATYVPSLFPYDQNPQITAAQYHHAALTDSLNQKLVQMTS